MNIDLNWLLTTLEQLPHNIRTYVGNIPEDALDIRRSKEAWTIREHIYHIAGVQEMLYQRIEYIKNDPSPVIQPYFPENETEKDKLYASMEEALSKYEEARKKQLDLIRSLGSKDMEKEATHREYKKYSIPLIINHMVFHEYWHMYRIEELWLTRDDFFT